MKSVLIVVTLTKDDHLAFLKTRNSILRQTFQPYHLIIDSSQDPVDNYINDSADTRVLHHEPNGIYPAMNFAQKYIIDNFGPENFILYLNSGDTFRDDFVIENIHNNMKSDVEAFYFDYTIHDPITMRTIFKDTSRNTTTSQLFARHPINHQAFVCRARIFEQLGGFDETLKMGADWDFILRVRSNFKTQHVALNATTFQLGGFSSQYRSLGNHELLQLRKKYLPKKFVFSLISKLFFFYREIRLIFYYRILEKNPQLLSLIRRILRWN